MRNYQVPFTGLPQQSAHIKRELLAAFEEVLDSGQYILGPNLKTFEEQFASLCGSTFAVGVANGTCALHLVWLALGLGSGDEVITASNSFLATASAIALTGATPVFVDIGPDLNIDPSLIEAAITPRTKGIVPVHLTGRLAQMPEINRIAEKHGLFVLEDAAQAVCASRDGRRAGAWGNAAGFSLHPLKNLFAYGDGGVITTSDAGLRDKLMKARNHGLRDREQCDFWSYNSRLDELQAALLLIHLNVLQERTERRRAVADRYNNGLGSIVTVPMEAPGEYCVYQTYMIQADNRNELQEFLQVNGVEALTHYRTPIHLQVAAASLGYTPYDLPQTVRACKRILSLPIYPDMTGEQQDLVIGLIHEFFSKHPKGRMEGVQSA